MIWTRNTLSLLGATFLFLSGTAWGIAEYALMMQKPLILIGSTYALNVALGWLATLGFAALGLCLVRDIWEKQNRAPQVTGLCLPVEEQRS